jgi:hypothetical protein
VSILECATVGEVLRRSSRIDQGRPLFFWRCPTHALTGQYIISSAGRRTL